MTAPILAAIHSKIPTLSKGQKRIAAYLLEAPEKAALQTAAALGKTVQVSESTVVRFAAEMGYNGYPEMQKALQEAVFRQGAVRPSEEEPSTEKDLADSVFGTVGAEIKKTGEGLDRAAFAGGVKALLKARRIYIFGAEASEALASYAYYGFHYIFEDVRLIVPSSLRGTLEKMADMKAGDALLLFSFPPYDAQTRCVGELARQTGARIIVLTDCPTASAAQGADFLLTASCRKISGTDSLAAPVCVLDAFIAAAASERAEEARQLKDKLNEIWDVYHVYEEIDE